MEKWFKLSLLGVCIFAVVLLLILFSSGFFKRWLIPSCAGENCPAELPDESLIRQQLIIENLSISPKEIVVPKDSVLGLTVNNNDGGLHRILTLEKTGEGFKVIKEEIFEPGEGKETYGFLNYKEGFKEEEYEFHYLPEKKSFPVIKAVSSEYLISCTTCTGENSQVKIILE